MIVMEDLKITNMTRSAKGTVDRPGRQVKQKSGLNREISYQSWGIASGTNGLQSGRSWQVVFEDRSPSHVHNLVRSAGWLIRPVERASVMVARPVDR